MIRAVILAAMILGTTRDAAATPPPACPPPSEAETGIETLPHLHAKLKPGATMDILAVGTVATTPGLGPANAGAAGFVQFLGNDLQAGAGAAGLHVTVTSRGGRGQDAGAQLAIIRAALKQHHYTAVLWQTGTLEAVRNEPAETFYQALADGADAITSAGADLILVEPQYSRFLEANADLSPYLSVMQTMDAVPGTLLFHRYELMRDWEDAGTLDLEHAARADRPAIAARLHTCLAAELARAVLAGIGTASR